MCVLNRHIDQDARPKRRARARKQTKTMLAIEDAKAMPPPAKKAKPEDGSKGKRLSKRAKVDLESELERLFCIVEEEVGAGVGDIGDEGSGSDGNSDSASNASSVRCPSELKVDDGEGYFSFPHKEMFCRVCSIVDSMFPFSFQIISIVSWLFSFECVQAH